MKPLKSALTILIASVCFVSCQGGWSKEFKDQYLEVCLQEAQNLSQDSIKINNYCQCSLSIIMQHYPTIEESIVNKDSIQVAHELENCRKTNLQ